MKKSGAFAISAAAASATVASASSSSGYFFDSKFKNLNQETSFGSHKDDSSLGKPVLSDKFAPRYDGLRFIETLVTGHR